MPPKTHLTDAERIEIMYAILKVKNVNIHGEKEWDLVAAVMQSDLKGEQARSRWRGMEATFKKDGILKDDFQTVTPAEATSNSGSTGETGPKVKKPRAKKVKTAAPEQAENGKPKTSKRKREEDAESEAEAEENAQATYITFQP